MLETLPQKPATLHITVSVCTAPDTVHEWSGELPAGADVADALRASGWAPPGDSQEPVAVGVWGKVCELAQLVADGDRVEVYRALIVDPKVARRERFARQGSRAAGLFARDRKR